MIVRVLFTLLVLSSSGFPAITLVAHSDCVTGGASCTTPAIDTTGANLIVVAFSSRYAVVITDSQSNTWVRVQSSAGYPYSNFFYVMDPVTSASHIFTCESQFGGCGITAWKGVLGFHANAQTTATHYNTLERQPGAIMPIVPGQLMLTALATDYYLNSLAASSISAPYTILINQPAVIDAFHVSLAYAINPPLTPQDPTWRVPVATNLNSAHISFTPIPEAAKRKRTSSGVY